MRGASLDVSQLPFETRPSSKVVLLRVGKALARLQRLHAIAVGAPPPPGGPRLHLTPQQAAVRYRRALLSLTAHTFLMSPGRRSALGRSVLAHIEKRGAIDGLEGILLTCTLEQMRSGDKLYAASHAAWAKHKLPAALGGGAHTAIVAVPGAGEVAALTRDALAKVVKALPARPVRSTVPELELARVGSKDSASHADCSQVPYIIALLIINAAFAARMGPLAGRSPSPREIVSRAGAGGGYGALKEQIAGVDSRALASSFAGTFVSGVASASSGGASNSIGVPGGSGQTVSVSFEGADLSTEETSANASTLSVNDSGGGGYTDVEVNSNGDLVVTQGYIDTTLADNPIAVTHSYDLTDGTSSVTSTDSHGHSITDNYDSNGNLVSVVSYDPETGVTTTSDAQGNIISQTGGRGGSGSLTEVDDNGNIIQQWTTSTDQTTGIKTDTYASSDGYSSIVQTDADGNVIFWSTTETDSSTGVVTTTTHTSSGTITTSTDPSTGQTTTTVTDEDGNVYVEVDDSSDDGGDDGGDDGDDDEIPTDDDQYVAGDWEDWNKGDNSGGVLSVSLSSGDPLDVPTSGGDGQINWGLVSPGEGPMTGDFNPSEGGDVLNSNLLFDPSSDGDPREGTGGDGVLKPPTGGWAAGPMVTTQSEASSAMTASGSAYKINDLPQVGAQGVTSLGFVGNLSGMQGMAGQAASNINAAM